MRAPPILPYESKVICSGIQNQLLWGRNWELYRGQKPPDNAAGSVVQHHVCTKGKLLFELCGNFFFLSPEGLDLIVFMVPEQECL